MKSNLKKLRKDAGLTLEQLADMAGIVKSYVFELEKDDCNPTLNVARGISDALNIDIFDIWDYK